MVSTSKDGGKIVNNYQCYILVFLDSEEAHNATVGSKINLRLSDTREIDATIEQIIQQESGEAMIIFRTNKAVEELISYRKISIDVIWWSEDGLKVPNTAIIEDGAENYIIRNRVGYNDKILINIKRQNDKYSIIDNYTVSELRELGHDDDDIRTRKSISLYDEIVINPKE